MSDQPRFTIELTIRDNHAFDQWRHAIGCDEAMKISPRLVDEIKLGADIGAALVDANTVVRTLKKRELRREVLRAAAIRLAGQIADRLEDSEGWHDPSRVEPAKEALRVSP